MSSTAPGSQFKPLSSSQGKIQAGNKEEEDAKTADGQVQKYDKKKDRWSDADMHGTPQRREADAFIMVDIEDLLVDEILKITFKVKAKEPEPQDIISAMVVVESVKLWDSEAKSCTIDKAALCVVNHTHVRTKHLFTRWICTALSLIKYDRWVYEGRWQSPWVSQGLQTVRNGQESDRAAYAAQRRRLALIQSLTLVPH
jgi:hypothetical protein